MKKFKKVMAAASVLACSAFVLGACGSKPAPAPAPSEPAKEEAPAEEAAAGLNDMSLEEITAQAQEEGDVQSVGMPDGWANWELLWGHMADNYGLTHADNDMSSAEELSMFATEGENATKDMGDVGQAFGPQAIEQDLVQGYKTSYWDSVPDWAKGEDGKWMIAYVGATTFLVNNDLIDEAAPTSWEDIKNGSYKVSIGSINGGNAQAAIVASAFAFGGGSSIDEVNLDAAFDFWAEMAEAGRINTVDITQQGFETGEVNVGVVWSFTAIPYKNAIANYDMQAIIPSDGSIMSGYASVINKYAPHPAAAALTREVMFSDDGQTYLAQSGAIPTRTDVEIPEEVQAATFHQADYANAIPMDDTAKYSEVCASIVERWEEEIQPLLVQ